MSEPSFENPSEFLKEFSQSISAALDYLNRERHFLFQRVLWGLVLFFLFCAVVVFFSSYPTYREDDFSLLIDRWRILAIVFSGSISIISAIFAYLSLFNIFRMKSAFRDANEHKVEILHGLVAQIRSERERLTREERSERFVEEFRLLEAEAIIARYRRFLKGRN